MNNIKELLVQFKNKIIILCQAIGYSWKCFWLTTKGQYPKYEILQLAHRLEKGLLNTKPKPNWGWEKAYRIAFLMKNNEDVFSNQTGKGVLKAYIAAKANSEDSAERERAKVFENANPDIISEDTPGGVAFLKMKDWTVNEKDIIKHFFQTRHSCREYKEELVKKEDLSAAIDLALKCPSACNRQVTNCYVYQSKEYQTIILTANIRAYDIGEFNDWFVSPSIFAGYLSLTLHLYGIGSCIYRKQLYGSRPYNEKMRKICKIPSDEMIVLELQFGYYKEKFKVAVSNRHSANDITSFVVE